MKILVISDTHRKHKLILKTIGLEAPFDRLIHCGDIEGEIRDILDDVEYPVTVVRGNMDSSPWLSYENEEVIALKHNRILVTHGHLYGVNYSYDKLIERAREEDCDIVCFGHLHVPEVTQEEGLTIINPGSLAQPRQSGARPSYCVLTIDDAGRVDAEIRFLPQWSLQIV